MIYCVSFQIHQKNKNNSEILGVIDKWRHPFLKI